MNNNKQKEAVVGRFLIKRLIVHITALKCVRIKYPISGQSTERRLLSTDKNASKQFGEQVNFYLEHVDINFDHCHWIPLIEN